MNRRICLLAIAVVIAMSGCGPIKRLRNRSVSAADSGIVVVARDSMFISQEMMDIEAGILRPPADSPVVMGPFQEPVYNTPLTDTPQIADDSRMAMPFWMIPLSYNTFSGKAKAHYESAEESRDFTLSVRIESGKKIWLSVVGSAMGISMEAFRAVLTPDSMVAVNRLDREIIRAPFEAISELFPVKGDFYMLEAVLIGGKIPAAQVLRPLIGSENSEFTVAGNLFAGSTPIGSQTVFFRYSDSTMSEQLLQQSGTMTSLRYDNYQVVTGRRFSLKRGISLSGESGKQTLSLDYTSFAFDEPVDMTITIPEKYKQR